MIQRSRHALLMHSWCRRVPRSVRRVLRTKLPSWQRGQRLVPSRSFSRSSFLFGVQAHASDQPAVGALPDGSDRSESGFPLSHPRDWPPPPWGGGARCHPDATTAVSGCECTLMSNYTPQSKSRKLMVPKSIALRPWTDFGSGGWGFESLWVYQ